jgi:hypothetical protein
VALIPSQHWFAIRQGPHANQWSQNVEDFYLLDRRMLFQKDTTENLNERYLRTQRNRLLLTGHDCGIEIPLRLLPDPMEVSQQLLIRHRNRGKRNRPTREKPFHPHAGLSQ